MTRKEAIKGFTDYLKQHNISHVTDIGNGCQRYTMTYSAENAPPVFGVLLGKFTVDEVIIYIQEKILENT